MIVPIIYEEVGEYSSGLIMAFNGQDHIYFNNKGEQHMQIQEQPIGDFEGEYLIVKYRDKYGMINKKKQYILNPEFKWLEHFENGEARFQKDGAYGLISMNNDTLLSPEWDFISPLNEETRILQKEGHLYYYMNGTKSEAFDLHDTKEAMFRDGYAVVKKNGKYGVIDTTLEEILSIENDLVKNVGRGNFAVKYKNLVKLFSAKSGKIGSKLYQSLRTGIGENCIYTINISDGIVDPFENILFQRDNTRIFKLDNFYLLKHENGAMGLLNADTQEVLNLEYEKIDQIEKNIFELNHQNGRREIIDVRTMKVIFEY